MAHDHAFPFCSPLPDISITYSDEKCKHKFYRDCRFSRKVVIQCRKTFARCSHEKPVIHPSAFVADNATVRGSVTLGANSSVFFGAVLRGDRAPITIGAGTNIQDNCVVHVDYDHPVTVGENVTVGHGAILHGCTVGDNTLIGMGAIVLNGAKVGSNCLIGAGALVPQNVEIPDGSLAFGSPTKIKGQLDEVAIAELRQAALDYQKEAMAYKAEQEQ